MTMAAMTVYLDHNATTEPAPEVVREMVDALQMAWGNPSSTHEPGQAARRLLADARARVASFLGCQGAELVFTSGATESNHTAVLGALAQQAKAGRHGFVLEDLPRVNERAAPVLRGPRPVLDRLVPVDHQPGPRLPDAQGLHAPSPSAKR